MVGKCWSLKIQPMSRFQVHSTTMKNSNIIWLSAKLQERINPPPITSINKATNDVIECDIINIEMRRNLSAPDSETYKLKIATFENVQPEEFLVTMKNLKTTIEKKGNKLVAGRINYIRTMLRVEALK